MKSEKARQELEDGSWKVEVGCEGEDVDLPYHAVRVDVAQYAVELAEQEAEERMRKRAIGAFDDMWFENGEDGEFEPDYEYHRKNFIQKLNGE
jgi:hypothetical protein